MLLVIAEPCRNIGKYTLADILAYRNDPKKVRVVGAISTITVSTFYLTAQMVGGGVLVKTLIGIDYEISVIAVGVLMLAYVLFGGMVATTWVQIIKAILLVTASILLVMFVWTPYGFSPAGVPRGGGRRRQGAGAGGGAARRRRQEHDGRRARPALPRAGPAVQGADRPDLARHGAGVRHRRPAAHPDALLHRAHRAGSAQVGDLGDGDHRRLLRADAVPRPGRGDERRRRRTSRAVDAGGNMAAPLLAQYLGGGAGLVPRQPVPRLRGGGGLRHHRRGGRGPGAGRGLGDGARPVRRRDPAASTSRRRSRSSARAHRHGDRRRDGHHHRHRCQGPERRAPGGARLRGGRVGQLPVRAADAVLEALQHRRHRGRHGGRHADRDRPGAGVAEHDLPDGDQGRGAEGRRRRAGAR
ncbi:MAG: hypothetical protein MZW92_39525 [Comamonadaceae bacterium]|nr:hypothetical protein [Comamonadaceae bacterium]